MKVVNGNKLVEFSDVDFENTLKGYEDVVIDVGTGDGRFIYERAQSDLKTFFIGVDPVEKQLRIYSKKANRKKLKNVLFVLGVAEDLEPAFRGLANKVFIILPWGTLLKFTAKPDLEVMEDIKNLLAPSGKLVVIFGYAERTEPSEFERLELEEIDGKYLEERIIPEYKKIGLELRSFQLLNRKALRKIESSWSKKLSYGQKRPIFYLEFDRIN